MKWGGLEGVLVLDCSMPTDDGSDSVSLKSYNRFLRRQGADSRSASPHKTCISLAASASLGFGICGITTRLRGQNEEEAVQKDKALLIKTGMSLKGGSSWLRSEHKSSMTSLSAELSATIFNFCMTKQNSTPMALLLNAKNALMPGGTQPQGCSGRTITFISHSEDPPPLPFAEQGLIQPR